MQVEETVYIKFGIIGMADEAEASVSLHFDTDKPEEAERSMALYTELFQAKLQVTMLEFQNKFLGYLGEKYKDELE